MIDLNEIWKDIEGFEGKYQVSTWGRVRSIYGILKPYENKKGYLKVGLFKNSRSIKKRINRLVAIAFIPNPHNLPEELKLMQGFPKDYIIDRDYKWNKYPTSEQVKRIGNSVVPVMAEAIVKANCPYLKVGERKPNLVFYSSRNGQVAFA